MWLPKILAAPVRYRYIAAVLGTLALVYGLYWKLKDPGLPPTLAQVATTGGVPGVGMAPEVKAVRKALPAVKRVVQSRPVVVVDTASLPASERARIPAALPGGVSLHVDNAAHPDPVLTATAEVPKTRAGADVRSYLAPSGETVLTVEPRKESFLGWEPRNVELEAGYGVGGKQMDATAAWWPVRIGSFHVGAQAGGWMEPDGGMKGAASIRVRWEPFR